jgi:predicted AlkP superfamily phosphohydrolase/phosphomutase/tetratricopeptide (TPR) repeat protein
MAISSHKKLLLIGWDGADWKVINRLIDAGKMPQLSKFVEQGVMGNLATLYPEFSPILWTSIATGKRPFKHGILGFSEPDPNSGGIRPVSNLSRTTKAIWNILSQTGRKSNVVGWWPSHPAEPINGVMVSNHYHRAVAGLDKPWPISPGTVYPPRLAKDLEGLRVHPEEITQAHLQPFVPELAKIDQDKDKHLVSIAKIIAECSSVHSAATAIMQLEPWDFMAIYYDAIDHFSHGFMNFHPPQMKGVSNELFEMYKGVVEGGYCFHDMMLGTLLDLAGEDTTVIIMSDHGFHPDHLRRRNIPHEPAGAAAQHRQFGILAMKGPGIKKDERIYGASLLDICPTILTCFGLPAGKDMDGRPLVNAFETPPEISSIPSWDDVPGKDGSHPPEVSIDPQEAHEAINQLVALGYIEKPNKNKEKAVAETLREQQYNLARSYMDANLHVAAVPIYEELVEKWPNEYRFGINLVMSYQALEQVGAARSLLENLFALKEKNAAKALGKLKIFNRIHKNTKLKDLSDEDKKELQQMQREAGRRPDTMEYLMGSLLFAEGDEDGALRHFRKVEKMNVRWPGLYIKLGNVYLKMKEWKKALDAINVSMRDHEKKCGGCDPQLVPLQHRANTLKDMVISLVLLGWHAAVFTTIQT